LITNSRVDARDSILTDLRREIHGPIPGELFIGSPLTLENGLLIMTSRKIVGPFHHPETGEEVLNVRMPPSLRYGVGLLYPKGDLDTNAEIDIAPNVFLNEFEQEMVIEFADPITPLSEFVTDAGDDFLDLSATADRKQSSMGITFALPSGKLVNLDVETTFGSYSKVHGVWEDKNMDWWLREAYREKSSLSIPLDIEVRKPFKGEILLPVSKNQVAMKLHYFVRRIKTHPELVFCTVVLENITPMGDQNTRTAFQAAFRVTSEEVDFQPYPDQESLDDEGMAVAIQDREKHTYAIGHGTAANWSSIKLNRSISTDFFPTYETESITPDIDGMNLEMHALVGEDWSRQKLVLESLTRKFGEWIVQARESALSLDDKWKVTGHLNLEACQNSLSRMLKAIEIMDANPKARLAFNLANDAIVRQRFAVNQAVREVTVKDGQVNVELAKEQNRYEPAWRPFQLGFLLQSIPEIVFPDLPEREIVDLIFFPTGGGKTEAYLGLSAFTIFYRRLIDQNDCGTEVLMRYTLRLLTSQQFTRAASLVCCMEMIRNERQDLGSIPFKIGVWLGGDQTPNTLTDAKTKLDLLKKGETLENKFLLIKCPYCGSKMGPIASGKKTSKPEIVGYHFKDSRFFFRCPDIQCVFGGLRSELPILVVDEMIYLERPDIVIGTVDKFAQMPWNEKTRALFGFEGSGDRIASPPNLIIQDELHLISGPLGSMAGLYEVAIQDLCTDHRKSNPIRPKIVASTATVARYQQQIQSLFGRNLSVLFPPPVIDSDDNFFARIEKIDGENAPGRKFVGVFAPGFGSFQTIQVRVGSSLMQSPLKLPEEDRDPYWTGLWFFNSIRELGNTISLLQSDIRDYMYAIVLRDQLQSQRFINNSGVLELTSRTRSDEVPAAIDALKVQYVPGKKDSLDVCLASNIIEVGIDIDRLGLLVIAGQPKTTSQYIQVSGRVGRNWEKAPGLVVTVYSPLKPRDRSHFEKFKSYHQKMYQFVEATSVTPFSDPLLERAMHAVMVGHVRLSNPSSLQPFPYPAAAITEVENLIRDAVTKYQPNDLPKVNKWLQDRSEEWRDWEKTKWNDRDGDTRQALMRPTEALIQSDESRLFWPTPNSLRNVDVECLLRVYNFAHMDSNLPETGEN
jgi:hypothetical protein